MSLDRSALFYASKYCLLGVFHNFLVGGKAFFDKETRSRNYSEYPTLVFRNSFHTFVIVFFRSLRHYCRLCSVQNLLSKIQFVSILFYIFLLLVNVDIHRVPVLCNSEKYFNRHTAVKFTDLARIKHAF
ncbi:MAG: hypothetical protein ACFFAV_16770 [Candidatus Hermodarchaeota archaeon]